jgi:IS5 family transposase
MFKALLLAVWYDLSDVKLAEALDDRVPPAVVETPS